jgi:hypothetical protein
MMASTIISKRTTILVLPLFALLLNGCLEPENKAPVAKFSYTSPAYVNEDILFDASASKDPDGRIAKVLWKFGDGSMSGNISVAKNTGRLGNLSVSLTVTDNDGASATANANVLVGERACSGNSNCWKALPRLWAKVAGIKWVNMAIATSFRNIDPGWYAMTDNSATRAMGEWHWSSCAKIGFGYQLDLKNINLGRDGSNGIVAGPIDDFGGILGQTYSWYSGDYVTEVDVIIDSAEPWGSAGESNKFDLQSVLTHEFGHLWRLDDLKDASCTQETMFWSSDLGATFRRTLSCGDKKGVQTIYGYECKNALAIAREIAGVEPARPLVVVSSEE